MGVPWRIPDSSEHSTKQFTGGEVTGGDREKLYFTEPRRAMCTLSGLAKLCNRSVF